MKHSLLSAVTAALFLLPLSLFAADPAKIYPVQWVGPGDAPAKTDSRFVPYGYDPEVNPKPDDKSIQQSSFRVECNASSWDVELLLDDPMAGLPGAPDNYVEIFFCPTKDLGDKFPAKPDYGDGRYYQFYGNVLDQDIDFYFYSLFDRVYTPVRYRNICYSVEKGKRYRVRLTFFWENFMRTMPLDGNQWLFNIVRSRGNGVQKWEGRLHDPKTWGRIVFPNMTEKQKTEIRAGIVARMADRASRGTLMIYDPERFEKSSFDSWKTAADKELQTLNASLRSSSSATAVNAAFEKARPWAETRFYVDSWPEQRNRKAWSRTKDGITYKIPPDEGVVYLTNLATGYTRSKLHQWTVSLDGKEIARGRVSELPVNVRLGELPQGGTLSVAVTPLPDLSADALKSLKPVSPAFAVERFMNGLNPGPAFIVHNAPLTIPSPKRMANGAPHPTAARRSETTGEQEDGYLLRLQKMLREGDGKAPRIFFIGDSITAGLCGSAWKRLAQYRPLNLGNSGDWVQNVLWRAHLGVFDHCKPELVVLMIGTNNSTYPPEEIAAGVTEIVKHIRQRTPNSKILLIGILPRGKKFPQDGTLARANQMMSALADGKNVIWLDAGKYFLEKDGVTVKGNLFQDGLHPNDAGNNVWVDAMLPVIEKVLPPEKN